MSEPENNEFYVGYLSQMPPRLKTLIRVTCAALLLIAALAAFLFVIGQRPFPKSTFEFGEVKSFEGFVREYPYPALLVPKPGQAGTLPVFSRYLLVAEGKHGATDEVSGMHNKQIQLKGTLIYRDEQMMIEVEHNSVYVTPPSERKLTLPESETKEESLGTHTLVGEIVDSKCYLGVMNPGNTKVHRECAVRCISGGVPPLFIVRDTEGKTAHLLLAAPDNTPVNQRVLDYVAEPVEITGEVVRQGEQLFLKADPKTYRRVQ